MSDTINNSGNMMGVTMGSNNKVKQKFENVTQTIQQSPNIAEDNKQKLAELIEQLKSELAKATDGNQVQAEEVKKQLNGLVEEASKPDDEKDEDIVEVKANKLKKAAQNIAGAMPAVATIVGQILPLFGH